MSIIENKTFPEERALYGSNGIVLRNCRFDGVEDGESALKESKNVQVYDTYCNLRYPFWHDNNLMIKNCELTAMCRAALWYSQGIEIFDTKLHGIKALRECSDVLIDGCDIISPEFGWSTVRAALKNTTAESEYFMLRAADLKFENVNFKGKYSFQYVENAVISDCVFNTKDAFWHCKNVTVKNSVINGEYLAWYSDGLTLENCVISGTQPFCYCKNLKLIDCRMENADLAFEKSEVEATVTTPVISIKNPERGCIRVPSVGQLIMDDPHARGRVIVDGEEVR